MTVPKQTDDEFIALWNEHKSVTSLAKALHTSVRQIARRRRNIERRCSITLAANKLAKSTIDTYRIDLDAEDSSIIVFGDAHYWPGPATTAHKALILFKKLIKPTAIILNGDAFDGSAISRFPQMQWMEKKNTVKQELDACKERLSEIEADFKGQLIWNLGNHDLRYEAKLAATAGHDFEYIEGFHLRDHFPRWRPSWVTWVNNDVLICHRMRMGIHATHTNIQQAHISVITGHLHSQKVTPYTDAKGITKYGVDHGMLAEPLGEQFRDYLEGKHANWRSGFVILTWRGGELLSPELVTVWDEETVQFRGHLIDVNTGNLV